MLTRKHKVSYEKCHGTGDNCRPCQTRFVPSLPHFSCVARSRCHCEGSSSCWTVGEGLCPRLIHLCIYKASQVQQEEIKNTSPHCKSQCLKDAYQSHGSSQPTTPPLPHTLLGGKKKHVESQ